MTTRDDVPRRSWFNRQGVDAPFGPLRLSAGLLALLAIGCGIAGPIQAHADAAFARRAHAYEGAVVEDHPHVTNTGTAHTLVLRLTPVGTSPALDGTSKLGLDPGDQSKRYSHRSTVRVLVDPKHPRLARLPSSVHGDDAGFFTFVAIFLGALALVSALLAYLAARGDTAWRTHDEDRWRELEATSPAPQPASWSPPTRAIRVSPRVRLLPDGTLVQRRFTGRRRSVRLERAFARIDQRSQWRALEVAEAGELPVTVTLSGSSVRADGLAALASALRSSERVSARTTGEQLQQDVSPAG
jgi:hypothetical protein